MRNVLRYGAATAATVLLLAPALWNRFPLLQYDTGGYLARWFEGYLVPSRSTVYGLLLAASAPFGLWPAVLLQTAATLWIVALALRVYGFGGRPGLYVATIAILSCATALPWLADILITDIFCGLAVLALHLVMMQAQALRRWERAALVAFVAFCASTHTATLAVLAALSIAALLVTACRSSIVPGRGAVRGAAALALGALLLLSTNWALSGRFAWMPGGWGLQFARMLQDGLIQRYLAAQCPHPGWRLCDHQAELPKSADAFLWGQGVFDRLGRFAGLGEEMRAVAIGALQAYPGAQIAAAARDTVLQLGLVGSGEGMGTDLWHTYGIVKHYTPWLAPAMNAARQQHGELHFDALNIVQVPIALLSMALLPIMAGLAWRRRIDADLGLLAVTVTLALLANAFVCGALSNPHDRYGARLAWVAVFVVLLAVWRRRERYAAEPTRSPISRSSVA